MTLPINLVADIGGTNLRIGITNGKGGVDGVALYQCNQFSGLAEIIQDYLSKIDISNKEVNACFAIACPVDNDIISMTNLPWKFSKKELQLTLNLTKMYFINDYTAIAHAVPFLSNEQKVQIGAGNVVADKPISICGPGTGLGVANVINVNDQWISLGGEGGHVDFAPTDEVEIQILNFLLTKYKHVSYEQVLSGLGLQQIYQALMFARGVEPETLEAKDITLKAMSNECDVCVATLNKFCEILGNFAGNLSLTLASFGGVYIAGGIVPRFIEFLSNSNFRRSFEAKGRFEAFNQAIPTFVITEPQPGLLGASAFLSQQLTSVNG
jgi:glucokinase